MPNMSGLTLAQKIRCFQSENKQPRSKIIAVTAAATQKEKKEAFAANVLDDYIIKPLKIETLEKIFN